MEISRCHVRLVVITGRQFALATGFDRVNRVLGVHEQAVVEIFAIELRVRTERTDRLIRSMILGANRDMFYKELDAVQRRRALPQFLRIPEQIIDTVRLEPQILPTRDLLAAVRTDVRLGDVSFFYDQAAIPGFLPNAVPVHRDQERRIGRDLSNPEGTVTVDVEFLRQFRVIGVHHDIKRMADFGVLLDVGEQPRQLVFVIVKIDRHRGVGGQRALRPRHQSIARSWEIFPETPLQRRLNRWMDRSRQFGQRKPAGTSVLIVDGWPELIVRRHHEGMECRPGWRDGLVEDLEFRRIDVDPHLLFGLAGCADRRLFARIHVAARQRPMAGEVFLLRGAPQHQHVAIRRHE